MANFEDFLAEVRARLERGRIDFEDRSLERPATELITEVQEELADVAGWSAILWSRLERIRELAARAETAPAEDSPPRHTASTNVRLCGPDREQALATIGGRVA